MSNIHAQLDERQRAFVAYVAREGLEIGEAATRAGYAFPSAGYGALKSPAVSAAIHETIQRELNNVIAPLAFRVAKKLLADDSVSPRVRADIAFKFLDRAGHITPSNKQQQTEKALSEMSRDELLQFIDRNQAAIDKVEQELAERATDVSAPHQPPQPRVIDAKPLSFLD